MKSVPGQHEPWYKYGVAVLLLAVPNLTANLIAMLVAGLVGPWLLVAATTALQTRTPAHLLGRVTGVFQLSLGLPQITSIGLGAALIAVVNYRILLLAMAVVIGFSAVYLASRREPDVKNGASALQQADSMPRESAGTF